MLLLTVLACTHTPPEPTVPEVEPAAVVVFVRHAEKAKDGTPDPPLTEAGQARAQCLVEVMRPAQPRRVLATNYQRTQATVAPTAAAFGLTPEVLDAGDDAKWLETLRASKPGTVTLVAGHSNTIPQLVQGLGGQVYDLDDKGYIPDHVYDRMVVVTLDRQGRATSSTVFDYCRAAPAE
ncbi:MAG: histidine phosphatase family protein [Alphaproteobacteria bacterium]|nr:histidine phosphatase family protein [Alphaproteobacteria bacterium]